VKAPLTATRLTPPSRNNTRPSDRRRLIGVGHPPDGVAASPSERPLARAGHTSGSRRTDVSLFGVRTVSVSMLLLCGSFRARYRPCQTVSRTSIVPVRRA
jgi:hypothetical protein